MPFVSHSQVWQWGRMGNSNAGASCRHIVTDAYGNSLIAGNFNGNYIVFGADTIYNGGLTNVGLGNYLVKYNTAGNVMWAKSINDSTLDIEGMTSDAVGNIYICGGISASPFILGTDTLVIGPGSGSSYIAKLDPSGNIIWARTPPGSDSCRTIVFAIAVDNAGNVFMEGSFGADWLVFGADTLRSPPPALYSYNTFIGKFDASGNALWGRQSSTGTASGNGIVKTDYYGNVFISGYEDHPHFIFGTDTIDATGNASFLVKYNASGNQMWTKGILADIFGLTTDRSGNVIATGVFFDTLVIGVDVLVDTGFMGYGWGFLAQFDSLGNEHWTKNIIGPSGISSAGTDDSGNVYVFGGYIDSIVIGTYSMTATGDEDILTAKYSNTGNLKWATHAGGTGFEIASSIAVDSSGTNIFITGGCRSTTVTFGADVLDCTSDTYRHIYVAKLNPTIQLSVPSELPQTTVSIYPNPAHDELTITGSKSIMSITINDYVGHIVYNGKYNEPSATVPIGNLATGLYLVTIINYDGSKIVKKVIKE